jgi:phosphotriesterase-related protein
MAKIQTVCGPISPSELGVTLTHEHLIFRLPPTRPSIEFDLLNVDKAIFEVLCFKNVGGKSIVDMSTQEAERNVESLKRISEDTGINVICCSGYVFEKHWHCPRNNWILTATIDELEDKVYKEVVEGIDGTGIKPGVLKAGSSLDVITQAEERVFLAIARAHLKTNLPISTHTTMGTMALDQLTLLEEEGVDPGRVIIGHVDRQLMYGYLRMLAKKGCYIEFDQIGKEKYGPDELRVKLIIKLVIEGYIDQILLSHDGGRRSYRISYGGWPGLTHIVSTFIPMLRANGLTQEQADRLIIDNPASAFAF